MARKRNSELDAIQARLGVSRRHAQRLLKELKGQDSNPPPVAEDDALDPEIDNLAPVARARLRKLEVDIARARVALGAEEKEAQVRAGQLLELDYVKETLCRPLAEARSRMNTAPAQLGPRLVNQPQRAIEATLAHFFDNLIAAMQKAV